MFKVTILFQKIKMGFSKILDILPTFSARNNRTDRQKRRLLGKIEDNSQLLLESKA